MTYIREQIHNNILPKRVKRANTPHRVHPVVRLLAVKAAADV